MSVLGIGVIGCGHWGPNHVRVFSQIRDSRVVACADLDAKRLEVIQEQHPQVSVFQDYRELLKLAEVDAVVVAAPTRVALPGGQSGAGGQQARAVREAAVHACAGSRRAGGAGQSAGSAC